MLSTVNTRLRYRNAAFDDWVPHCERLLATPCAHRHAGDGMATGATAVRRCESLRRHDENRVLADWFPGGLRKEPFVS